MALLGNRIHLLDDVSQQKIKYTVQILSLNDVILELIKNALDAQSRNIKVVLNYTHGFCSVLDDGHGISASEFEECGGLGKPYHTSKAGQGLTSYGRNGSYLAALAAVSLLSIASRIRGGHTHVLWLDATGRVRHTKESPDTLDLPTGTRVKVHSLFSNIPVRSKALLARFSSTSEIRKEFDNLRHAVLGLLLAAPVQFDIRIEHTWPNAVYRHQCSIQSAIPSALNSSKSLAKVISAFRQAEVHGITQHHEWQRLSVRSEDIEVEGLIMKLPIASRSVQYISVNHLPLTKETQPDVYHAVNGLFAKSTFGISSGGTGTDEDKALHKLQSLGQSKGIDRWPMFAVWVTTTSDCVHDLLHHVALSPRAQLLLSRITTLMANLFEEFLAVHGFMKPRKERVSKSLVTRECTRTSQTASSSSSSSSRRLELSKESFRHWSRVKSSRLSVMDNILTGLPFHEKPKRESADVSLPEKSFSTSDEASDTTLAICSENEHSHTLNASETEDTEYGDVLWTDPQTCRTLRLDARTGMELPQNPVRIKPGSSQHASTAASTDPHCIHSTLHQPSRDLSLSQVAKNVQRYSKERSLAVDRPIRSISIFTGDGEELNDCCSTHKARMEAFYTKNSHNDFSKALEAPKISREALRSARVLQQVDRKFVLAIMHSNIVEDGSNSEPCSQLVLIDQHAADERCKVEALLRSVHADGPTLLSNPIIFEVSNKESDLLEAAKPYFARWYITYKIAVAPPTTKSDPKTRTHQIHITSLPPAIAERCRLHPKLIIDILRETIWSDMKLVEHHSISASSTSAALLTTPLPPLLLSMINSRACRSAIMFNDILTNKQCERLVHQLSECTLPFQCAHGRPSMVVITNIGSLNGDMPLASRPSETSSYFRGIKSQGGSDVGGGLNSIDNPRSFGDAYRSWITSESIEETTTAYGDEHA